MMKQKNFVLWAQFILCFLSIEAFAVQTKKKSNFTHSSKLVELFSEKSFQDLNWKERIRSIQIACLVRNQKFSEFPQLSETKKSGEAAETCKRGLELGLRNKSLVVRDYALQLVVFNSRYHKQIKYAPTEGSSLEQKLLFENSELEQIQKTILADKRNYRGSRELWILERARNFKF
jgi:hypothetical protein